MGSFDPRIKFLSVNIVTNSILLSVLFVSAALAQCGNNPSLSITAPKKMEALSGSCLLIPCNFSAAPQPIDGFDNRRETFGVWIKSDPKFANNPKNVIFNGSQTVNAYTMNITGNLRQKNCTTLFYNLLTSHTDTYYFRIENKPFKATASCDPLQISVKDSPASPRIEIPADLKEKESVTITCSALTPCPHSPPKLTWNLQQDSHNKIEENTDGSLTTKIQETITLSDKHDGYNITCSATYPVKEGVKTAEETKTLSVSYAPKDTSVSISPSALVSAGSWVNLTCSSTAKPPVSRFTWFKTSTDGPMKVSEGQIYSVNATEGGDYYCVATNDLGQQNSSVIHLTIEGWPGGSVQWEAVLGGIIGIIALIFLVVCICTLMCMRRSKMTHSTQQLTQRQTGEELTDKEPAREIEETEEEIHYGEIDFSKLRAEASSDSVQHSGQQQDSLYAQVKVSQPANNLTHTADGPEELYAQVKKK